MSARLRLRPSLVHPIPAGKCPCHKGRTSNVEPALETSLLTVWSRHSLHPGGIHPANPRRDQRSSPVIVVQKRGSGKSAGQPTRITRTRNGLSERGCPAPDVMIQKAVQPGTMDWERKTPFPPAIMQTPPKRGSGKWARQRPAVTRMCKHHFCRDGPAA